MRAVTRNRLAVAVGALLSCVLLAVACGSSATTGAEQAEPAPTQAAAEPTPTPPSEDAVDAVVGLGEISLVPVEFPDGATSVRPEGWTELGDGAYIEEELGTLLVFQPTGGDVQSMIELVETQFGNTAERIGDVEANGVTWSVFAIALPADGTAVQFAISPGPGGLMVLGQSGADDIGQLASDVLRPAVDAFAAAET